MQKCLLIILCLDAYVSFYITEINENITPHKRTKYVRTLMEYGLHCDKLSLSRSLSVPLPSVHISNAPLSLMNLFNTT